MSSSDNDSQAYLIPSRIPDGLLNNARFVDGSTLVPDALQTGSIINPYRTITQAVDTVPAATTAAESENVGLIVISPYDYDEDLNIDITGRRILLLSWGPWGLGTFDAVDWGPSGTLRNITISGNGTSINGIRTGFGIGTFEQLGRRFSTHQSYFTGARISGDILFTATGGSIEVDLECEVFGDVDASGTNPILQVYLYNGRYRGFVNIGTNGQFQHAQGVRFNGLLTVGAYSHLEDCRLDAGFATGSAANAGIRPDGFVDCQFTGGNFDGPIDSLRLDSYTDYWIQQNNISLVGGATKVFLDPQGKVFVRNETGATLTKGQAVYLSGYDNPTNLPLVSLAQADVQATSQVLGLVERDISNNANGWVVNFGTVDGLNTSAFADADPLWLSSTVAGGLTATRPSAPDYIMPVGYVLNAAGGTNGDLLVVVAHPTAGAARVYGFGADIPTASVGDYYSVNGTALAPPVAALDPESEAVIPFGGTLSWFSWNSDSANPGPPNPARTEWNVLQNGLVVATVIATGVRGVAAISGGPVFVPGDRLAVQFADGDGPDRSTAFVGLT